MAKASEVSDQLIATARLLEQAGNLMMSEFGITMGAYETMKLIDQRMDTTTSLAGCTKSTLANITHRTKLLEEKGMIRRTVGEDKRMWRFSLTPEGKTVLQAVERFHGEAVHTLFSQFSEAQMDSALRLLISTREHLEMMLQDETELKVFARSLKHRTGG
ncbi:MAG: hypothetical protein WCK39_04045 [Methanomassiliicoccales archaeon]